MNKFGIALLLCLSLFSEVSFADASDTTLLLAGQKDDVVSIVKKSLEAAFPDGKVVATKKVGYQTSYRSFWTGWHSIAATLEPMTTEDSLDVTAYRLVFAYKMEKAIANGQQDVKTLMEQITKQISQQNSVILVANPNAYRALWERADECGKKLGNDPDLQPLAQKISLSDGSNVTLLMLANESKPTVEEKNTILVWSEKRDKCYNMKKASMPYFPEHDLAFQLHIEAYELFSQLLLNLYKGEVSFGEFNKQRQSLITTSTKKFADLKSTLFKEQADAQAKADEIQHQRQLEQQRINIEQQKAETMRMEAYKPAPKPIPATTNCTSTRMGDTVQTNCY